MYTWFNLTVCLFHLCLVCPVRALHSTPSRSAVRAVSSLLRTRLAPAKPRKLSSMAWRCSGDSQADLVDCLQRAGIVETPRVAAALKAVDRAAFIPLEIAHMDSPQPIGYGATISAPHMHAHCLELLKGHLRPGAQVLDVGSGTGYLTAAFAHMVGPSGRAVGVEHIPELVAPARQCVASIPWANKMMDAGTLQLHVGDGRLGYPQHAPYDCIHVGAAAEEIPAALTDQLKPGGRLVVPVGPTYGAQELIVVDKDEQGHLHQTVTMGVRYVPLTDANQQLTW